MSKTCLENKQLPTDLRRYLPTSGGEHGGSVVERRTPEREVGGSEPTSAVLCP